MKRVNLLQFQDRSLNSEKTYNITPMKDTYPHFKSLSGAQKKGQDFEIRVKKTKSQIAVIAPHGGGIEPGTSEIAKSIAGENFNCYLFEGIKKKDNKKYLHITSTNFDEPECVEMCKNSDIVLAIHGAEDNDEIVYVGGRHKDLKQKIINRLTESGFNAKKDTTNHSGRDPKNICNRGRSKEGVQLEISHGLRKKMFKGLNRKDRTSTQTAFHEFVTSIRAILREEAVKNNVEL